MENIEEIKSQLELLKAELDDIKHKKELACIKNRETSKQYYKEKLKGKPQTEALKKAKAKYYQKICKKNSEKV